MGVSVFYETSDSQSSFFPTSGGHVAVGFTGGGEIHSSGGVGPRSAYWTPAELQVHNRHASGNALALYTSTTNIRFY